MGQAPNAQGSCATQPAWAAQAITLDPYALPQHVGFEDQNHAVEVTVDRGGAVMKRALSCGIDVKLALPSRSFEGVAARAIETADGDRFTLELHHRDPALCVPLMSSEDADFAVETWRSWARSLRMAMIVVEADGSVTKVEPQGATQMFTPQPRRLRHTAVKRRPRFLRRRKTGRVGPAQRVQMREIIARN